MIRAARSALAAGLLAAIGVVAGIGGVALAQHPHPQPQVPPPQQTTVGDTTTVVTGTTFLPPGAPFIAPPGTNFLPTVYTNLFDSDGREIPNTLPSTPAIPYNLQDGAPVVSAIDRASPTDDLLRVFDLMTRFGSEKDRAADAGNVRRAIGTGIDILEGNPVPDRAYSGFPLLHYTGPEKIKAVQPRKDEAGKVIGGEVHIHQIWYDDHVESDTALLDPSAVAEVPWTIVYTVDVLDRGEDDFAPFVMYFDAKPPTPLAGMDMTFFPMRDGTRTVFRIKMAPARYWSLVYTWGWRFHPPRVQVTDLADKQVLGRSLRDWETSVFGPAPRSSEKAKLAAIAKIGELSPAKRMWMAFREARAALDRGEPARVRELASEARLAYDDWRDRTRLPRGVSVDPAADLTILYVNNTIYGQFTDGGLNTFPKWQRRGARLKVTALNGDHFDHAYENVDFGGARGWENQFKSSVKVAGSGCWFTFGRAYLYFNLAEPVAIPAAAPAPYRVGVHKLDITFNYEPSRRLRFYQFDPTHHDVAVFSIH